MARDVGAQTVSSGGRKQITLFPCVGVIRSTKTYAGDTHWCVFLFLFMFFYINIEKRLILFNITFFLHFLFRRF